MGTYVDLHIHSYYSDGTLSPEQIVKIAMDNKVNWISITDHNNVEGSRKLIELGDAYDLHCISGVELDAIDFNINFHILGYGFDLYDEKFNEFINNNKDMLEMVNINLIKKIEKSNSDISISDYNCYEYDRLKGGWKALHYFVDKGITRNLLEGLQLYSKYDLSYTSVNFPSVTEVCSQIHKVGGKAILAHPGKVIKYSNMNEFNEILLELLAKGIDGIECYYPTHSNEITKVCVEFCRKHNLMVTSGADCHGTFQSTQIGELTVGMDQLCLKGLEEKFSSRR